MIRTIGRVISLDGRALDRWFEASNHDSNRLIGVRYCPAVDFRLVEPTGLLSDLTVEDAKVTDHPDFLGKGVLKR